LIVVHISGDGKMGSKEPLRITRLGSKGEHVNSLITGEHTLHVAPGTFEVIVLGTPPENGLTGAGQKVTVGAYQERQITIAVNRGGHHPAHSRH
jgi:hypothetical protein